MSTFLNSKLFMLKNIKSCFKKMLLNICIMIITIFIRNTSVQVDRVRHTETSYPHFHSAESESRHSGKLIIHWIYVCVLLFLKWLDKQTWLYGCRCTILQKLLFLWTPRLLTIEGWILMYMFDVIYIFITHSKIVFIFSPRIWVRTSSAHYWSTKGWHGVAYCHI